LPRHASLLRVAFPVLARVDAIAGAPYPVRPVQDPHERRQRAFASLRELLGRVAERHLLVLVIDDLQWGDGDSAQLLQEVLRPPDAPPLLLVLASRDEDSAAGLVQTLEPSRLSTRTSPRSWRASFSRPRDSATGSRRRRSETRPPATR
jgi:predicted ATPase